ncbi:MAG: hypothetical protein ACI9CD_000266 [Candidatus Deianiraeaceae bacterium]|jgi:hypothetical protein
MFLQLVMSAKTQSIIQHSRGTDHTTYSPRSIILNQTTRFSVTENLQYCTATVLITGHYYAPVHTSDDKKQLLNTIEKAINELRKRKPNNDISAYIYYSFSTSDGYLPHHAIISHDRVVEALKSHDVKDRKAIPYNIPSSILFISGCILITDGSSKNTTLMPDIVRDILLYGEKNHPMVSLDGLKEEGSKVLHCPVDRISNTSKKVEVVGTRSEGIARP